MKLEQAARQALVALEDVMADFDGSWALVDTAITALREALAGDNMTPTEQAEQRSDSERMEPVAWMWRCKPYCDWPNWSVSIKRPVDSGCGDFPKTKGYEDISLYASPVRTKDLTDDEIINLLPAGEWEIDSTLAFASAVIAADREKNRG